jgi:hypothetical protein
MVKSVSEYQLHFTIHDYDKHPLGAYDEEFAHVRDAVIYRPGAPRGLFRSIPVPLYPLLKHAEKGYSCEDTS